MERVLLTAKENLDGCYVAMKSENDNTIVGYSENPEEALEIAARNGYNKPILIYVPDKSSINIYFS
jgi:hypothetical protein